MPWIKRVEQTMVGENVMVMWVFLVLIVRRGMFILVKFLDRGHDNFVVCNGKGIVVANYVLVFDKGFFVFFNFMVAFCGVSE